MANSLVLGVVAALHGPFAAAGEDGVRGVKLAINDVGGEVAGQPIRMAVGATMGMPDGAATETSELITRQRAQIIVGPLSGNEGLAVCKLAPQYPHVTFVNGASGAQDLTMQNTPANFFNFALNGAQGVAGIGEYAYRELGYRRVVTLGENYSFPHVQVGCFLLEFGHLGGQVVDKLWVRLGETDFTQVIAQLPADIDAIFLALGGSDAINFIQQYSAMADTKPIFGGILNTDQSVLSSSDVNVEYLQGVIAGGPTADDNLSPLWQDFVTDYRVTFPDAFNYPSYFATQYYINAKAVLLALEQVDGDLSNNHAALNEALRTLEFDGPCAPVRLDANQGAISSTFITQVEQDVAGRYYRKQLQENPNVQQTLGMSMDEYLELGVFTAENPALPLNTDD